MIGVFHASHVSCLDNLLPKREETHEETHTPQQCARKAQGEQRTREEQKSHRRAKGKHKVVKRTRHKSHCKKEKGGHTLQKISYGDLRH